MRSLLLSVFVLGALGCSVDSGVNPIDEPVEESEDPEENFVLVPPSPHTDYRLEVTSVRDLDGVLAADARLVGVTVDEDTGGVYVLTESGEIYSASESGAGLMYEVGEATVGEAAPQSAFTDFVSLGRDRFAITAANEGFLLDTAADTLDLHFCYLPGPVEEDPNAGGLSPGDAPVVPSTSISVALQGSGIDVWQLTNSLAYDSNLGVLWAQPNTLEVGTDAYFGSELASFDLITGEPLSWTLVEEVPTPIGGLGVSDGWFVGADGDELSFTDRSGQWQGISYSLEDERITAISGLHAVAEDETGLPSLYLVDSEQRALFTLEPVLVR